MKKLVVPVLAIIALGLAVYNTFTLGKVRPVTISPTTVQLITPKLVEQTGYDYSTNMVIGNKLVFTPVSSGVNNIYPKSIGQLWLDKASGHLRYWDGNTATGAYVALGKEESDMISFRYTATDSADFPALIENYGWATDYVLVIDSLEGAGATMTLKQLDTRTGHYNSMNETVFPFTIALGTQKFYTSSILKYQRMLISKGSATKIKGTLTRTIRVGQ